MLNHVLDSYLQYFPLDKPKLKLLLAQLKGAEQLDDRQNFNGHIAGDALVLSPDYKKILYIYHKRSRRWQQPGGHWDMGEDGPWLTAEREAVEETGVKIARRLNLEKDERIPLHVVTGPVLPSAGKDEPGHWHHDFRYGFVAADEKLGDSQDEGVAAAKWFTIKEALAIKDSGHEVHTSIRRLLQLLEQLKA